MNATEKDGEWIDEFGAKYSANKTKLIQYDGTDTSYNIREGTKHICDSAFYDTSLTSITIPNSVISIGDTVFYGSSLISIIIPNSVKVIGRQAFERCKNLEQITISNSVKSIEERTFDDCQKLKQIIIPNSVEFIDTKAFMGCKNLTSVTITNTDIGYGQFGECNKLTSIITIGNHYIFEDGVLYNSDKTLLIRYLVSNKRKHFVVPCSVTSIRDFAFDECTLDTITIPKSFGYVSDMVFGWNGELRGSFSGYKGPTWKIVFCKK